MVATLTPAVALAGSGGRRNTAIALTGGALYTWLNGGTKRAGRRNTAIALTAASVVAWHKYKKAKRAERRRARLVRYYRSSYNGYNGYNGYARPVSYTRGYRSSYRPASYGGRSYRRSSNRYCHDSYGAGVRAGA
jgi:hypothetical protein